MKKNNVYKKSTSSRSFFILLASKMNYLFMLVESIALKHTLYLLYLVFLGLIYIFKTHHYEQSIRQVHYLNKEVADLRVDLMTLTATYMSLTRQSTIAKKVAIYAIYPSKIPPQLVSNYCSHD